MYSFYVFLILLQISHQCAFLHLFSFDTLTTNRANDFQLVSITLIKITFPMAYLF